MSNDIEKAYAYKEECVSFMAEVGLPLDGELIVDGKIHRYSADQNKNKRNEWYIAFDGYTSQNNYFLNCTFSSWKDGEKYQYSSFKKKDGIYNSIELKELKAICEKQTFETQNEISLLRDETAKEAERLWGSYSKEPPTEKHSAYLKLKQIKHVGDVRFGRNPQGYPSLVVPIKNIEGKIRSLQYISVGIDGETYKTFLSGGEKKGNHFFIGNLSENEPAAFVGEGYATCASIYEVTNRPTVVVFDAGNIESALKRLKQIYPKKIFIIASDCDEVGIKKAREASKKLRCSVVIPCFSIGSGTDFNDLTNEEGMEEARNQLIQAYAKSDAGKIIATKYFDRNEDPCKNFKLSNLPPVLREYIYSIQKTTSAHPIMITASVLAMVSGYLGTKVYIPEGEYFQKLYSNIWLLCIARSGQFKTTALNKGASIAYKNQSKVFKEIKELREYVQEHDAEIEKEILIKSRENVLLPTKMTAEGFLEHVSQGHQGVIPANEFGGWLQNLDKNHNNDFKAIMTELFDGPECYRYKTKTQGDCIIERPYISICGVSTISWIRTNLKPTDVPSGFFARFLLFTPPFKDIIPPGLPSSKIKTDKNKEKEFEKYIARILDCIGGERIFTLSEEAKVVFNKYHILIYCVPKICSDTVGEVLQPYFKRWSPYILKIATILQLFIDPEVTVISRDAVIKAFHFLSPAIKSTIGLFEGELGESAHQRKCRIVLDWIKMRTKKGQTPIKRQDILSSKQLRGGAREYDIVLQDLIEQGKLEYKEFSKKNDSEYMLVEQIEQN